MTAAPARPDPTARRTQEGRSAAMRLQLMEATTASLIEHGYARTTTVEICRRAGVTRGALLHHFDSLAELLAATLTHIYERLLGLMAAREHENEDGAEIVDRLWAHFSGPEYKAIIELWLACRNEPELGVALQPAIDQIRNLANPRLNPRLAARLGTSKEARDTYRLILETMIGLTLGRAVSPDGGLLGHEADVLAMLRRLGKSAIRKR